MSNALGQRLGQATRGLKWLVLLGTISVTFSFVAHEGSSQANLSISFVSGGTVNGSVTAADVESGFVLFEDETELEISADVNWQVTASVTIDSSPAGTGNPTALALEVGNNDSPGQFNAGGGLVQTGSPGTVSVFVDFRLNLSTLGDSPAGNYEFSIMYTLEEL